MKSGIRWIRSHCVPATKYDLEESEKRIMAKVSELAGVLNDLSVQLDKAQTEIVAQIKALEDALGNVDVPADAQAAIDKLKAQAQALDDLNPDVPPPTT